MNRCMLYGPHAFLSMEDVQFSEFEVPEANQITGIFVDPSTSDDKGFTTIGVATDIRDSSYSVGSLNPACDISHIELSSWTSFQRRYRRTSFMTKAHLLNVQAIELQKIYGRCMGLLIKRRNGIIDIFGQWDPIMCNKTTVLYDTSHGPLGNLTFVFSECSNDPLERYVEDVLVQGMGLPTTKPTFTWANPHLVCTLIWQKSSTYRI